MNKNLKTMLTRRITQPSNATVSFVRYLSDLGYQTDILSGTNRHIVRINNKIYAITITGHKEDYLLCRQYSKSEYDGLISFDESTGVTYIVEESDLRIQGCSNREMHDIEFQTAYSKNIKLNNKILDNSIPYEAYKIMYNGIAKEIANNIIERVREI